MNSTLKNTTGEIVPKFEYAPSKNSTIPELYNGGVEIYRLVLGVHYNFLVVSGLSIKI